MQQFSIKLKLAFKKRNFSLQMTVSYVCKNKALSKTLTTLPLLQLFAGASLLRTVQINFGNTSTVCLCILGPCFQISHTRPHAAQSVPVWFVKDFVHMSACVMFLNYEVRELAARQTLAEAFFGLLPGPFFGTLLQTGEVDCRG